MDQTVCYEQPLNERMRSLLRLEFLFEQFAHALAGRSRWDARSALHRLLEILIFTGRTELRSELIKELERHSSALGRLRQAPGVDDEALATILGEIAEAMERVYRLDTAALDAVRQNDFLNGVRQRSAIPGGTCSFDLPALHHWLQGSPEDRTRYLEGWIQPLHPLQNAIGLLLRLIRSSSTPSRELALQGFFQKTLDANAPNQMVRVILPVEFGVYPEISGGRHRFSIRFMEQPSPNRRPVKSSEDVPFDLVCCII